MATIVKTDGTQHETTPKNGKAFTLDEVHDVVGGYFETVNSIDGRLMLLNEDGKRLELPTNMIATMLSSGLRSPHDVIVGDVLLCTREELGETDELEE